LIKRKNEPFKGYLALPGGFVNEGEKVEDAAKREVKEETSIDVYLTDILGVYSDPNRDPRGRIMSTVFIGELASSNDTIDAKAQDDAEEIEWIPLNEIDNRIFGFDHRKILLDYKKMDTISADFLVIKILRHIELMQ
jgi:8-oxo-dGTP diphosphatase